MTEHSTQKTVIGLTGNIGVGKSTVMALLAELGADGIDADGVAHEVMEPGQLAYQQIVAHFGAAVAPDGGPIDRMRLGQIVFSDPAALAQLEAFVHPAVAEVIQQRLASSVADVVVIEAIKLLEAGLSVQLCDQIWVVTAPRAEQIRRLMATRGLSEAEAVLRIDAQPPQADKVAQADVVIDNSGDLAAVRARVRRAWREYIDDIPSECY